MTAKKDLKKRVRARQARTGESYSTARQQVLAGRSAVPVVELMDLSAEAGRLGLRGRVLIFPDLPERVDPLVALQRLREVLDATADDPGLHLFRATLLHGIRPEPPRRSGLAALADGQRFLARARAGLGGVSDSGMMLALPVQGRQRMENVVCLLWGLPITHDLGEDHYLWLRLGNFSTSLVLRSADSLFGPHQV